MSTTHVFWYLARSSGLLAYLFAWASVTLGLLMTTRVADRIDRATQYILHRLFGLGSMVFLGLHLITLFLDPWANFSIADLFVPFHTSYRPFWTGCGILAAYLLVTIAVTSIFQQRLPKVLWRGIHYLSFLTFFIGLAHGIGSGTDSGQLWARGLYLLSAFIVAVLTVHRALWEPKPAKRGGKSPAPRTIDPRSRAMSALPGSPVAASQTVATRELQVIGVDPGRQDGGAAA
jgi:sulfoxide reductase heme-binding subunit YedZ